jgi:hypothetical protein
MTDRRVVAAALLLGGCPRRSPPPAPPPADVVDVFDVPAPQADVPIATDIPLTPDVTDAPRTVARGGPWRNLPRVDLTGITPLGRWDDAPDRDGDELPDVMLAVHWNSVAPRCTPVNALRSCPRPDPDDTGPDARDGAFTLGYLTLYSGDAAEGDAGPPIARVLGTRRVWRAGSTPLATLRGVEFTEFGGGVITRAVLDVTDGAGANDIIDVADLFVGAGAERHVGAMVHHCRTPRRGAAARGGSLALWDFSLAPLVFRAAMAHPFSGCAAELGPWERDVAAAFSNGLTVTVTHDEPVSARGPRVGIATDPLRMVELDAAPEANPLRANDLEVLGVERVCRGDRVRWRVGAQRCAAVIPRDDAPVQGCAGAVSALDPTRAEPVAVVAHGDAAADLLLTRGQGLLRVTLPRECRRHARLDAAVEHRGEVPPRVAASPGGGRVIVARGHDLWMWSRGRLSPVLVNGPGTGLPRGTTRALAFLDARTVAAVISNHLVTFTFELSPDGADPPELIDADAHLLRAPR